MAGIYVDTSGYYCVEVSGIGALRSIEKQRKTHINVNKSNQARLNSFGMPNWR